MNTQNILKNYGSFFDLKLDSSEFYDYELSKTDNDYNSDVLNLNVDIVYDSLKINETLNGLSCERNTITLNEIDFTDDIDNYIFKNIVLTLPYDDFIEHFNTDQYNFNEMLLNNHVFKLIFEGNEHFFNITQYNEPLFIDSQMILLNNEEIIDLFDVNFFKCINSVIDEPCCDIPQKLNVKEWAYSFKNNECSNIIEQRTPSGWTVEIVFNRDGRPWSDGSVFYYLGTRGSKEIRDFADNNLTFSFTNDGKIKWESINYNVFCDEEGNLTEDFITNFGLTPELCVNDSDKDFVITITFERNRYYFGCDLENEGGINDLKVNYGKSPEINGHFIICGPPPEIEEEPEVVFDENKEDLNELWSKEKFKRIGTLKIYLNGRPIYKNNEFEEIIPSNRGPQPYIQSWGGNHTTFGVESGISCFNLKKIKYYEEPLPFINVRHNVLRFSNIYDIEFCDNNCVDEVLGIS